MPAFNHLEIAPVIKTCAERFLAGLPERTKIVVLLGNADDYLAKMSNLIRQLHPNTFELGELDEQIAYQAAGKWWVHVSHPSRGNGHFDEFLEGDASHGQGRKREIAKRVVRRALDQAKQNAP